MSEPKKIATIITAGIAAAASMAAPAMADETAVTPDEQAGKALEQAQQAANATNVADAKQAVSDAQDKSESGPAGAGVGQKRSKQCPAGRVRRLHAGHANRAAGA